MPARIKGLLKLLIIAVCFGVIARRFEVEALYTALHEPRLEFLALALSTIWCEPLISAIKWRLLIHLGQGEAPPMGLLIKVVFTSNFLSLMAPTALSADILRIWMLRRRGYRVTHTMSALITDRVLGLGMLFMLALIGWWYGRELLQDIPGMHVIPLFCLLGMMAIGAAFSPLWLRLLQPLRARQGWCWLDRRSAVLEKHRRRIENTCFELLSGFQAYRRQSAGLAQAAGWNLAIQVLRVLQVYYLFRALGAKVPFMQTLAFVPLIVMVSLLPISFYGLGFKEGAFWYLFAQVGIAKEISITASLLTYPLILSALLPGLWFFLRGKDDAPETLSHATLTVDTLSRGKRAPPSGEAQRSTCN